MTEQRNLGGYKPADLHDLAVKEAAHFAIECISKTYHPAQLQRILYAESQIVNGTNYHLVLAAVPLPAFHVSKYDVIVHKSLQNAFTLIRYYNISEYIPGGYSPIDINEPEVKDAAQFAMSSLSKLYPNAGLVKIVSAASQVVAGVNFHLVLEVTIDARANKYDVTVFRSLFGTYELTSHRLSPPEPTILGGYKTISPNDSGAKSAAKASIDALANSYRGITLLKIISAEVQVVAGLNYHLELEIVTPLTTLPSKIDIVVYRSLSGDYKIVSYTPIDHEIGGYTQADVNSQDVKDAAKFTVDSLNKLHNGTQKLEVTKILAAETQVVAGTNYHLILDLSAGVSQSRFDVVVFKNTSGNFKLTSHHVVA
jgi:hypothetical protein